MSGTNPAQLAVTDTPAAMFTVSDVFPVPPVQYIWKDHAPIATVCAGRFVHANVVVMPPAADWIEHGVAWLPTVALRVVGAMQGEGAVPCRYSGLPAAATVGACTDSAASPPKISASTKIASHPIQRGRRPCR